MSGDAKGASLEAAAVGGLQRAADMGVLDRAYAAQAVRREDEARFGVALPIGAGAVDQIHELESGAARRERSIEGSCRSLAALSTGAARRSCRNLSNSSCFRRSSLKPAAMA